MPAEHSTAPLADIESINWVVLEGLIHRGELAALELAEARDHTATTMAVSILAGVCALLAGVAANLTLVLLVWSRPDRDLILGAATLLYVAGAVTFAWWAWHRLKLWKPLAETFRQLGRDLSCVRLWFAPRKP